MRTKNFQSKEFKCPCCELEIPNVALFIVLQAVSIKFGEDVLISSGCRCWKYHCEIYEWLSRKASKKAGHTVILIPPKKSKHLNGEGADIKVINVKPIVVFLFLDKYFGDILGLSCYSTFVHVDVRGYSARW